VSERKRKPGAIYLTREWRERVGKGLRRYHALRRELARVMPSDLARLRETGTLRPELLPLLGTAEVEAVELLDALGGPDRVSPQRRALIEDTARLGLVMRASLVRFMQSGDGDSGGRVNAAAAARRANLVALGLDRVMKDVPDLDAFLRERTASSAGEPIETTPDAVPVSEPDRGSCANGERESHAMAELVDGATEVPTT